MMIRETIPYHKVMPLPASEYKELEDDIKKIIKTGQITNGIYVKAFENEVHQIYPQFKYVIATNSCTQALLFSLNYLRKKKKKNGLIQLPIFNWWSDLYVIELLDMLYIPLDVSSCTWLPLDSPDFPILYVNTFGNIGKAKTTSQDVVYDSSHCFGAKLLDKEALSHCISFAPTKLITTGEGGIILTNHHDFYEYVLEMRNRCGRMPEINARIGLSYIPHVQRALIWKENARYYYEAHLPGEFQEIKYDSSYNTIGFINTENLKIPEEIEYRQYYKPLIFSERISLTNTYYLYNNIICLPSYYNAPLEYIVKRIKEVNKL